MCHLKSIIWADNPTFVIFEAKNDMLKFTVDTKSELKPYPHFWERCIFAGHASLALRDDWRKHLKICHDELGFQFIRLHGFFNDETGIYRVSDGQKNLSFYNLDNIFDFIRA